MKAKPTKRDEIAALKRRMRALEAKIADRDTAYVGMVRHCRRLADSTLRLVREKEARFGVQR